MANGELRYRRWYGRGPRNQGLRCSWTQPRQSSSIIVVEPVEGLNPRVASYMVQLTPVRRRGWVWAPSVAESPTPPERSSATSGAAATRPQSFTAVSQTGAAILTAPDGDTLANTLPRTQLEVTAREGNWV